MEYKEDFYAIKDIVNEIVGDTHQGEILLGAIEGFYNQKEITIIPKKITKTTNNIVSVVNQNIDFQSADAMKNYTAKLKIENEKFRKRKKKNCSTTD